MAKTKSKPSKTKPAVSAPGAPLVIRHYCQGIGDCHLLKFAKAGGGDFWVLIDCGIHTSVIKGDQTIDLIVADIAATTKGHIDLLVVTHEHWDHVSGFHTAAEAFSKIKVDKVWMAWTEDPTDKDAVELDKYRDDANNTLQLASSRLGRNSYADKSRKAVSMGLKAMEGFGFGVKGQRVRTARDAAKSLAKGGPVYLEPGGPPLQLTGVDGLNVYVLGPPRDRKMLRLTTRASEMYGINLAPGWKTSQSLRAAAGIQDRYIELDAYMPFGSQEGVSLNAATGGANILSDDDSSKAIRKLLDTRYLATAQGKALSRNRAKLLPDPDASWRRIDDDWLFASAELALQFDSRTNNTSLVLAFEFIDTGRVVLFAGDAQIGNWLSWKDLSWSHTGKLVSGHELLARTVYLKVSHHGSENATPEENGLELMVHPDLSAFIPVNADDAEALGWNKMPLQAIIDRLAAKTSGRTIRADDKWLSQATAGPSAPKPAGSIRAIRHKAGLWVEVDVG